MTKCSLGTGFHSTIQNLVVEMPQLISEAFTAPEEHREGTLQPFTQGS